MLCLRSSQGRTPAIGRPMHLLLDPETPKSTAVTTSAGSLEAEVLYRDAEGVESLRIGAILIEIGGVHLRVLGVNAGISRRPV